jgi:hypothetical protein
MEYANMGGFFLLGRLDFAFDQSFDFASVLRNGNKRHPESSQVTPQYRKKSRYPRRTKPSDLATVIIQTKRNNDLQLSFISCNRILVEASDSRGEVSCLVEAPSVVSLVCSRSRELSEKGEGDKPAHHVSFQSSLDDLGSVPAFVGGSSPSAGT